MTITRWADVQSLRDRLRDFPRCYPFRICPRLFRGILRLGLHRYGQLDSHVLLRVTAVMRLVLFYFNLTTVSKDDRLRHYCRI